MVEFPTLTFIVSLLVMSAFGTIIMWLRESGAREERERQERMREYERRMEESRRAGMQALREQEERRKKLLAQMSEERRKLYDWQELAEDNDLESPEAFVNFHAEIGAILEEEKADMLREVEEVWDRLMGLPKL